MQAFKSTVTKCNKLLTNKLVQEINVNNLELYKQFKFRY